MKISTLWKAPEVNPITLKARSVPVLNPFNKYGRVFLFSWLGFMIAFWAWYTFPPLLTVTIRKDLALTPQQVANSNIVSLSSTLLMRVIAGPACDKFGSRWVFGGMLLLGSLPIGLAPLVNSANGLYVSRFFIGILGGTFVPCQPTLSLEAGVTLVAVLPTLSCPPSSTPSSPAATSPVSLGD
ncbi:Nitrate transporter like protein [Verticillium longisporum]|nr:Nitrate transporter like protein [Verticillium longisporum]